MFGMNKKTISLFLCFSSTLFVTAHKKPNIIFILVDDLGYSDLNFIGEIKYSQYRQIGATGNVFY